MLFFLLKSQDKVETLEPEALVMFISRTFFSQLKSFWFMWSLKLHFDLVHQISIDIFIYMFIEIRYQCKCSYILFHFHSGFIFLFLACYMTNRYSLFNCHIFAHPGQFMNLLFTTFHQKLNKKGRNKNSYYQ